MVNSKHECSSNTQGRSVTGYSIIGGSLKSCPWPDPEKKVTHEVDAKAPVVGSAAYAAAKASAAASKDESPVDLDAGWQNQMEKLKRELHVDPAKLYWRCDRGYGRDSNVKISGETPVAVAVHCAPNALFALGHNVTDVAGSSNGEVRLICGDATVCPPGMRWIGLASIIAGLDPIENVMVNRDLLAKFESNVELMNHCKYINSPPSGHYEKFIAEAVRDVLEGSFTSTAKQVLGNKDVIHLIDYLFGYWAYSEFPASQLWKDLSRADIVGGNDESHSQLLLEEAHKLSINSLKDRQNAAKVKKIGAKEDRAAVLIKNHKDRATESDTESPLRTPGGSESPSDGDLEVDCYVMSEDELEEMRNAGDKSDTKLKRNGRTMYLTKRNGHSLSRKEKKKQLGPRR